MKKHFMLIGMMLPYIAQANKLEEVKKYLAQGSYLQALKNMPKGIKITTDTILLLSILELQIKDLPTSHSLFDGPIKEALLAQIADLKKGIPESSQGLVQQLITIAQNNDFIIVDKEF